MKRKGFELRLLGEVEIVRDGLSVALPASKKTRALLGFLALTGRPHLREALCDLLWDGPDDPRASLRWSLAKLRPLVNDGAQEGIEADRTHVALAVAPHRIDLHRARSRLGGDASSATLEDLREVAQLLRGELLEGLDLRDCYRFQEWLAGEREMVKQLRVTVLETLVARSADGSPEEALRWARVRLSIDPLVEAAHAAVARLLGRQGRRAEGLGQLEKCRRILEMELGAKATWESEKVRLELVGGRATTSSTASATTTATATTRATATSTTRATATSTTRSIGLVGRPVEIEAIECHLAPGGDRQGRVLLLTGEPGIGKTRLLEHLVETVSSRGGLVMRGRAFEAERVRPYGPWLDALRMLPGPLLASAPSELAVLLPELARARPVVTEDDGRPRLFDAMVGWLASLLEHAGVALVLDDIQWLDEASAALLHYVARSPATRRLVIACGARPVELGDNRPVSRMLRGLAKDDRLHTLELAPLTEMATRELAALVGASDLDAVANLAGGNPLFAIELARSPIEEGSGVPVSLDGVLAERFDSLDPRARDVLPWAAALGHTFDAELLASATGLGGATLVGALTELESANVVRAQTSGGDRVLYDFSHDLIRAAAYRTLGDARGRMVHLAIARALSLRADVDAGSSAELGRHAALGGDARLAASAFARAGERCLELFARDEADTAAQSGLAQIERLSGRERFDLEVALLRVRAFASWSGTRDARLDARIMQVGVDALAEGFHSEAANAFHALSVLRHGVGDDRGAQTISLRAAEIARGADPAVRARTAANSACCLVELDRSPEQAHALLLEARAVAEAEKIDVCDVWLGLGLLALSRGQPEEARSLLDRAYQLARREADAWRQSWILRRLCLLALEEHRFDEAIGSADALADLSKKLGEGSEGAVAAIMRAASAVGLGDPEAEERLDQAEEALRKVDARGILARGMSLAANAYVVRKLPSEAVRRARTALESARAVKRRCYAIEAHVALADALLLSGDRQQARAELAAARQADDGVEAPSARLRASLDRLEAACEDSADVPSRAPTVASTPRPQDRGSRARLRTPPR